MLGSVTIKGANPLSVPTMTPLHPVANVCNGIKAHEPFQLALARVGHTLFLFVSKDACFGSFTQCPKVRLPLDSGSPRDQGIRQELSRAKLSAIENKKPDSSEAEKQRVNV